MHHWLGNEERRFRRLPIIGDLMERLLDINIEGEFVFRRNSNLARDFMSDLE